MSWILTHTGRHFDLVDPQPDMINVLDIAHGLSNCCRFAGHSSHFYSVAQHSVLASRIVPAGYELEALLHDASEAYLGDVTRPLKLLLPDYRAIEQRVEAAIRAAFGLPSRQSDTVTHADRVMLATERRDLMPQDADEWAVLHGITAMDKRIHAVNNNHAKSQFTTRLLEIYQQ